MMLSKDKKLLSKDKKLRKDSVLTLKPLRRRGRSW
jgi:hypothetical protein